MLRWGSVDFSAEIAFNGNKWNRLGDRIEYQLVASISAKGLKVWRKAQPFMVAMARESASGLFAAKAFPDPERPDEYFSWELSGANAALQERMAQVVEDQILPWLRACEDPANYPELELILPFALDFIELALMQGRRDVALSVAEHAIAKMQAERELWAKQRGVPLQPLPNVDMPLADLLRWKDDIRNLKGLIAMHKLEVKWPS